MTCQAIGRHKRQRQCLQQTDDRKKTPTIVENSDKLSTMTWLGYSTSMHLSSIECEIWIALLAIGSLALTTDEIFLLFLVVASNLQKLPLFVQIKSFLHLILFISRQILQSLDMTNRCVCIDVLYLVSLIFSLATCDSNVACTISFLTAYYLQSLHCTNKQRRWRLRHKRYVEVADIESDRTATLSW